MTRDQMEADLRLHGWAPCQLSYDTKHFGWARDRDHRAAMIYTGHTDSGFAFTRWMSHEDRIPLAQCGIKREALFLQVYDTITALREHE